MQTGDLSASTAARLKTTREMMASGHLSRAADACADLMREAPRNPAVHILAAKIGLRMGRRADATAHLQTAAEYASGDPTALVQCAALLLQAGARRASLAIAARAESLEIPTPAVNDSLGALLTHHDEPNRALLLATRAVQQAPENAGFRFNLAMVQRMTGDFEAAEDNLDRVIRARPLDTEAYLTRSGLRKQTPDRNHVAQLQAILAKLQGQRLAVPVGFALAKELEDLGDYESSFEYLQLACRLHRGSLRYEVAADIAVLDALRHEHLPATLARVRAGFQNDESCFIVGLPRSGTTLLDRMLGRHPAMYCAGELKAFPEAVIEAVNRNGGGGTKLDFVKRALQVDFEGLGSAYLEQTRPRTGHTAKFTDKLPLNYLYAGLINAALPRARLVALRRDPVDSCYAMYKTLFVGAYPFSYDLDDLGRYFVAWDRLMRHWEELIAEAWHTVRYEDLVNAPEATCRAVVEHCGLTWDEACLSFHASNAAVGTASAVQVRQPIYRDSVGKWRHYERQLAPLIRHLGEHGLLG